MSDFGLLRAVDSITVGKSACRAPTQAATGTKPESRSMIYLPPKSERRLLVENFLEFTLLAIEAGGSGIFCIFGFLFLFHFCPNLFYFILFFFLLPLEFFLYIKGT
ncbi:hypothetical protein L228DRAFT_97331 [Xylona heveae TC161]|uniref:Uncharacterized protein n=1 Tax=Xylona heveae (strain CBS 132557 / TC161) TaxID=1328760 RepID=A0A161TES7_XYLHT|nr:hypothetical protein L228DRAFT_97331 [Xylona heveae TC161]KZF24457.1 hypothetical protein L228DRAFT_97331 [Xylona heveae TC161]